MEAFYHATWGNIITAADYLVAEDDNIIFDRDKEEEYKENINQLINVVKKYMSDRGKNLDRHKIAAIIMVSIVKTAPFRQKSNDETKTFVGNYVIATEVGLSYMRQLLNECLIEMGEPVIDKYYFPKSWTCQNDYFRVFYRNLYFSDMESSWGLNPLDIAEKLFLLEYVTLEKEGIDIKKLEYKGKEV